MKRAVAVVGLLLIVGITAALGNWQLRRAEYKRAMAAIRSSAQIAEPTQLNQAVPDAGKPVEGRAFVVTGHWETGNSIFIDNRTHQGIAGFHVLSALRITAATAVGQSQPTVGKTANPDKLSPLVLVLRGWVPANRADRNRLPAISYPVGLQTVRGFAQVNLPQALQLGADQVPNAGDRLWQYFDLQKYRRWSGLRIHSFVLRQTSESDDGLVREWPAPGDDVDRHNGYAFQWFAMSLAVMLYLLWLVFKAARLRWTKPPRTHE